MVNPQQLQKEQQKKQLKQLTDLLLQRKLLIIGCTLIALIGGLALYLTTDKVYQSNALIVYQREKITTSKISPDETRHVEEMVSTVSRQVTSRKNLEEIILKFDLYKELRKNIPIEDVIAKMRDKHIETKFQLGKSDIFSVSYTGNSPRKVMLVTNALASQFIEENLRVREERISETASYVNDELKMAQEALDKKELVMRDYKLQHYNEMPEQRESNMQRLSALQQRHQEMQANAQALEYTKLLVLEQISLRKQTIGDGSDVFTKTSGEGSLNLDGNMSLEKAEKILLQLLSQYTEQHPKVKFIRAHIKQLKSSHQSNNDKTKSSNNNDDITPTHSDPQLQSLVSQLIEINFKLERIENESNKIAEQMTIYQKWIEATPIREAEWSSLTRDYEQLRKHYEYLLENNIAAKSAESLERHQKGSQFKIVDSAFLPELPLQPNFRKIMAAALALGMGVGVVFSAIISFLDSSFKTPEELESYLDVPIVTTIPLLLVAEEKRKAQLKKVAWVVLYSVLFLALMASILILWKKGIVIV